MTQLNSIPVKYLMAIAVLLLLPFPVWGKEALATTAEKEAAAKALVQCRMQQAQLLDDGYSDALTIGQAVASACRIKMLILIAAITKGKNPQVVLSLREKAEKFAIQDATKIVLLERKRRLESKANAAQAQNTSKQATSEREEIEATKRQVDLATLKTANGLSQMCRLRQNAEYNKCHAFIRGVINAYRAGFKDAGGEKPFCLPDSYRAFDWFPDVLNFIDAHPEVRQFSAEKAVIKAMISRYPC